MVGLTICSFRPGTANKEVIRFNIPIDEVPLMNRLHTGDLKDPNKMLVDSAQPSSPFVLLPYRLF